MGYLPMAFKETSALGGAVAPKVFRRPLATGWPYSETLQLHYKSPASSCPITKRRPFLYQGEMTMGQKIVRVVAYRRYRFGQWEDVCTHLRSHPSR